MHRISFRWFQAAAVAGLMGVSAGGLSFAADEKAAPAAKITPAGGGTSVDDKKPLPTAVEDGTPEEMLKQLAKVISTAAIRARTYEEFNAARLKQIEAGEAGAKKILAHPDTTDAQAENAARILISLQTNRIAMRAPGSLEKGIAALKELEASSHESVKELTEGQVLAFQVAALPILPPDEADRVCHELLNNIKATHYRKEAVDAATRAASTIERSIGGDKAVAYHQDLVNLLNEAPDDNIKKQADRFEGIIRKLQLPGKMMELKGVTVEGQQFDLADLKGKVVLVDFWATWCGPCIAEMPNVRKMYAAYHDKGFDVVGISLDNDRSALEEFIKKKELPWTNLFVSKEDEKENAGWKNPLARYYGVNAIPCCILVGADGKVITLNARGKTLEEELAKLLGPAPEAGNEKPAE